MLKQKNREARFKPRVSELLIPTETSTQPLTGATELFRQPCNCPFRVCLSHLIQFGNHCGTILSPVWESVKLSVKSSRAKALCLTRRFMCDRVSGVTLVHIHKGSGANELRESAQNSKSSGQPKGGLNAEHLGAA